MPRDLLRALERAPVREVRRDARRPERVAARRGRQPRGRGPTLDHRQNEPPIEGPARQPPPSRVDGLEERHLRLLEPARLDVGVEGRGRPVVGRDFVPLPALLVEPQPAPAPLPEVVLPPHPQHRAHPREAVEHHREERPVPEPGQSARVDRLEELPRLRRREDRRRALGDDVLRPPHGRGGVHRKDLADDEPVAEHADRGQVLLHRGD